MVTYTFIEGDCKTGSGNAKCSPGQTPGPWPCKIEGGRDGASMSETPAPQKPPPHPHPHPAAAAPASGSAAALVSGPPGSLHDNVTCTTQKNIDHKYNDIRQVHNSSTAGCCALCKAESKCAVWVLTYDTTCWLKFAYGTPGTQIVESAGAVSMCTAAGATSCPDYRGDCSGYSTASSCTFNTWQACNWDAATNVCAGAPAPPRKTYICGGAGGKQCIPGMGRVNYDDPNCLDLCGMVNSTHG